MTLDEDITAEDEKEILFFFKSCQVQSGRGALLEKLRATVKFRCEILEHKSKDLREIFPFYFTSPDLSKCLLSMHFQKKFDRIDPNINLFIKLFSRLQQRRSSLADALKYFTIVELVNSIYSEHSHYRY